MAVEHIVLMKLREALPNQKLEAVYRECEAHFDKVPDVVSASMGENFSARASGFTHAVVLRCKDRKALDAYMTHPEHKAAATLLQPLFMDFVVIDYETERS